MTNPVRVEKTFVYDEQNGKKEVRSGDQVTIMPADTRVKTGKDKKLFLAQERVNFLEEWLGKGPFTILWIGRWPCGRDKLYLTTSDGNNSGEPGCHVSNFMSVN